MELAELLKRIEALEARLSVPKPYCMEASFLPPGYTMKDIGNSRVEVDDPKGKGIVSTYSRWAGVITAWQHHYGVGAMGSGEVPHIDMRKLPVGWVFWYTNRKTGIASRDFTDLGACVKESIHG